MSRIIYQDDKGLYLLEYDLQRNPKKVYCNEEGEISIFEDEIGLYFVEYDREGIPAKAYCDIVGNRIHNSYTQVNETKKSWLKRLISARVVPNRIDGIKAYTYVQWIVYLIIALAIYPYIVYDKVEWGLSENDALIMEDAKENFVFMAVYSMILAPIGEELVFRWLIFGVGGKLLSLVIGRGAYLFTALVSIVLFVQIHEGWEQSFCTYGLAAVVFTFIYYKTGRIGVAMLAHAINNIYAFSINWIMFG